MGEARLLLKGGRMIDPARGVDAIRDVAFAGGVVAAEGPDLPAAPGDQVIDAAGLIVTPGLIDLHTHVYWGGTSLGVDVDDYAAGTGVTTAVDAGSAGPGNFAGFRAHVIAAARTRILAYLHISHSGVFGFSDRVMVGESEDLRLMDPVTAVEVARANPDVVIGIKVRIGRHASGDQGVAPLEIGIQAAEAAGLPLMAHIDHPPPDYVDVVRRLRPGDVLTHCFRPFPNTPLGPAGEVRSEVLAARDRGVIFDIGHGKGSFAFATARGMLAAGFAPDVISSDVHKLCIDGPAFDLVTTMTKLMHVGMDLTEVVRAATAAPARAIGRPDLADLSPGSAGDATLLAEEAGAFPMVDTAGERATADRRLVARGAVLGGRWREGG